MEVVSVVEGRVPNNRSGEFEADYAKMREPRLRQSPKGGKTSYLINDRNDRELYRILAFWEGFELLDNYIDGVEPSESQALFRRVGVESHQRVLDVSEHLT